MNLVDKRSLHRHIFFGKFIETGFEHSRARKHKLGFGGAALSETDRITQPRDEQKIFTHGIIQDTRGHYHLSVVGRLT